MYQTGEAFIKHVFPEYNRADFDDRLTRPQARERVNFSAFLGYRRGDKPGTYEIVHAEADVVQRIYRQFLEGYSRKMIADGL
ncbi:MAG: hypothetical protein IJT16_01085, partial [Lachnospiraceae bacterium]|nr:hypothetical protein [Lachnospiraceae bacterium]